MDTLRVDGWFFCRMFMGWMIAVSLFVPAQAWGGMMDEVKIAIDGKATQLVAKIANGDALVPLDAFCALVGAEAKVLEGDGPLAVCREDLCIPLNTGSDRDTLVIGGTTFARLEAFGAPLGLSWEVVSGALRVTSGKSEGAGLGIGQVPPAFTLPDLFTGKPVAMHDYRGKKAVFYMWASW